MNIIHVLADGTKKTDITGHVVKKTEAQPFYDILNKINRRQNHERTNNKQENPSEKSF